MSGVATKFLRRSRSVSFSNGIQQQSSSPNTSSGATLLADQHSKIKSSVSLRSLHCSILHPRAPKIRHLNSSHALLLDLDKHIAKVQELEYKVTELEARIAEREALKQIPLQNERSPSQTNRFTDNLVTEEDRVAFQNRLNEARQRAEELSRKTNLQEANILSWHSKRLKQVLEALTTACNSTATAEEAPKLLAAPKSSEELEQQENKIFDALNALVGMANEEVALNNMHDSHIQQLKNLVIERENLKLMLEGSNQKLTLARTTALECHVSLQNMVESATALRLQLKSSQAYLMGSLLRESAAQRNAPASALWIYGPNPIFTGVARLQEISASVQNNALEEALRKTDISQALAENNLAFALKLVHKHKVRLEAGKIKFSLVEQEIEKQVEAINASENGARSAKIVEDMCKKSAIGDVKKSANIDAAVVDCDNNSVMQHVPVQPVVVN
jgi:hypothetical protein